MSSFTILVDSNCDLPADYLREHGIEVLPMPFQLDGKEHSQGYWQDISGKDYYDALRKGGVAGTSQINLGTFISVFTEYAQQGRDLLFLVLSSGLSSTYNNAVMALKEVRETYPDCGIFPVDTLGATSGHGLLAMLAVQKRAEGLSARETAAWLEQKKQRCFALFTVDDLMYLHRGGRLSRLSAIAGSLLGFKPILCIAPDGTLKLTEKARGRKAAFETLLGHLKRSTNPDAVLDTVLDTILVNHTDCQEEAQAFAEQIKATVKVRQVIVMLMGPVIGAHLGPGAITLLYEADMTRAEYDNKEGRT